MRQFSSLILLIALNASSCGLAFTIIPSYMSGSRHNKCLFMTQSLDENAEPEPKRRVLFRRNTNSRGKRARILRSVQETPPIAASSPLPLVSLPLLPQDDLSPLVQTVVRAVDMRKAENICVLQVSHVTSLTEFIIICCGNSRPQNQAIAAAVQQEVRDNFDDKFKVRGNGAPEGSAESGWIILDYGDIMVHVMTPRSRLYFDLETKWKGKGAATIDISSWLKLDPKSSPPTSSATGTSRTTIPMTQTEDDPFWS